jgi:SAM-dependent methyltransferase
MKDRYTYGDSDDAAARLALLASAYQPSSARLLESLRCAPGLSAVDLGCGPGFTTELVQRALAARQAWGLDSSERMVAQARARAPALCAFAVHDVTASPMPAHGVGMFFARYLLTHVASPALVLKACAAAAAPGCVIALEENCALESNDALFSAYYARVQAMHVDYGQDLYVGLRLPSLVAESGAGWTLDRYERTTIVLDARVMARLHAINIRTWSHDPFAASTFDPAEIAEMTRAMDAVAAGARDAPPVTCTMGQAVGRFGAATALRERT